MFLAFMVNYYIKICGEVGENIWKDGVYKVFKYIGIGEIEEVVSIGELKINLVDNIWEIKGELKKLSKEEKEDIRLFFKTHSYTKKLKVRWLLNKLEIPNDSV